MKITIITSPNYDIPEIDGEVKTKLETDTGEFSVSFQEGEPEDMTLGRNLSDAYYIYSLLVRAYEAGKRGEKFEGVTTISKEDG